MENERKAIHELFVGMSFSQFAIIRVKVLKKTKLRTWERNNKKGVIFSFLLIDELGDTIEAACFEKEHFDTIKEDETYEIQKFALQKPE